MEMLVSAVMALSLFERALVLLVFLYLFVGIMFLVCGGTQATKEYAKFANILIPIGFLIIVIANRGMETLYILDLLCRFFGTIAFLQVSLYTLLLLVSINHCGSKEIEDLAKRIIDPMVAGIIFNIISFSL